VALAAVVGTDTAGRPQRVNLDEQAHGGNGPHMLIAGPATTEIAAALSTVATALARRQEGTVRLLVCGSEQMSLDIDHEHVRPTDVSAAIDHLLDRRSAELASLGCADVHQARMIQPDYPTYVVMIELRDPVASLERGLRMGRSLGVHFVIGCVASQAVGAGRRPELYADVAPEILRNIPQGFAVTGEQMWSEEWSLTR